METWRKTTKETTWCPRGQAEGMELLILIADNGNMEEKPPMRRPCGPWGQAEGRELLVLIADNGNMKENHKGDDLVAQGPGRGHGAACANRR